MQKTNIEWTDATWNPIRGCSRVSEGCRHCYAEKVAYRFSGPGKPYEGLVRINAKGKRVPEWNREVRLVEKHLLDPLRWKPVLTGIKSGEGELRIKPHKSGIDTITRERPRRIFVNSMSDLFHENVPDEWIDRIFAVMALCPQHQFQVLTKRPERMREYLLQVQDEEKDMQRWMNAAGEIGALAKMSVDEQEALFEEEWPLPNVWLGVSVENQEAADKRIPLLMQTPAAVRFISAEPLLGPVSLTKINTRQHMRDSFQKMVERAEDSNSVHLPILRNCLNAIPESDLPEGDNPSLNALTGEWFDGWDSGDDDQKLDWVIVGGESGPGARPMHPDWARSLRDQCQAAGVAFFFKQWGEWAPGENVERNTGTVNAATLVDSKWFYQRENLANDEGHIDDEPDLYRIGKHAAGALLDGREWREFPGVR